MHTSRFRPIGVVALLALLGACGSAVAVVAPASGGLDAPAAAAVLGDFDRGDSAASSAGNVVALGRFETGPGLQFSTAAAATARARGRVQPPFRHADPVFALPATAASGCFLSVASLLLTGDEHRRRDMVVFQREPGAEWKASHSVVVDSGAAPDAVAFAPGPAVAVADTIPEPRRTALAATIFGRSTGVVGSPGPGATVAASPVLDGRLAGGLTTYRQQLTGRGAHLDRSVTATAWAPCGARTATGTLAFLVVDALDTLTAPGGVTLDPDNPDAMSTGQHEPLRGGRIEIRRMELFLLSVPDDPAADAVVLGLNDAAVGVAAS